MKTSLKKFGRFALHHRHVDPAQRRYLRSLSQLDELAQASQDLDDMRDCYDSLLAAAAATTNTAYEFSESLRELGSCLLEKTALNDDEDSGKVLLMLGKMQFELQKLLDRYRSHISRTITIPSQSLLNELRTVEEMKRNCDEKRSLYEYMIMNYREKGRSRTGKGENFTMQQLQDAREQYDEEATLFIFRLKSLKQGQSRSLLTQAARHHAAQLQLLRNSLESLEAVEPHVRHVTEQQHIDYQLNGLNDDYSHEIDDEDDSEDDDSHNSDSYVGHDDKELSFDYRQYQENNKSIKRHSMELDQVDNTFPKVASRENLKENNERSPREYFSFSGNNKAYTQSAPLFAENKPSDLTDRMPPVRQSLIRKLQTYVLPTPGEPKSPTSSKPAEAPPKNNLHAQNQMAWHSSPLQQPNNWRKSADEKYSGTFDINALSILKESNKKSAPNILPPPLAEGLMFSQFDPIASSTKKFKRQAYSGPLTKKTESSQPLPEHPQLCSGPILRNNRISLSSPKASHFSSPLASSPRISELHELPRPPASSTGISSRPPGLVGHSAPLASKGPQDTSAKPENMLSGAASPLPRPPSFVSRSFSIPTRRSKISEAMQGRGKGETPEAGSPPSLKPLSLTKSRPQPDD